MVETTTPCKPVNSLTVGCDCTNQSNCCADGQTDRGQHSPVLPLRGDSCCAKSPQGGAPGGRQGERVVLFRFSTLRPETPGPRGQCPPSFTLRTSHAPAVALNTAFCLPFLKVDLHLRRQCPSGSVLPAAMGAMVTSSCHLVLSVVKCQSKVNYQSGFGGFQVENFAQKKLRGEEWTSVARRGLFVPRRRRTNEPGDARTNPETPERTRRRTNPETHERTRRRPNPETHEPGDARTPQQRSSQQRAILDDIRRK